MAELLGQFEKACSNVEPVDDDKDNAATAHTEVRKCLEEDPELCDAGIDTILIGSYKRRVSTRRVKDVDVFCKMPELDPDLSGDDALGLLERVLDDVYDDTDRTEQQDCSIKIDFPDFDLHVDAVPARPAGLYWEIPDRDGGWQATNPEELTRLTSEMNDKAPYKAMYVPTVKLVRQTRRAAIGDEKPGGLLFEIMTYHAFNGGLDGVNIAQLYVAALRSVADQARDFANGGDVADPTMDGAVITVRATDTQLNDAASKFATIADKAAAALDDADVCRAAKAFQDILGKNDDGDWVFELPGYCNTDGTRRRPATTAGDRVIPAGNRRFA